MNTNTQRLLIGAAIASIVAVGSISTPAFAKGKKMHCQGVNDCKGKGGCKSGAECKAGSNECKGKGFMAMTKAECAAAKKAEAAAPAAPAETK